MKVLIRKTINGERDFHEIADARAVTIVVGSKEYRLGEDCGDLTILKVSDGALTISPKVANHISID